MPCPSRTYLRFRYIVMYTTQCDNPLLPACGYTFDILSNNEHEYEQACFKMMRLDPILIILPTSSYHPKCK